MHGGKGARGEWLPLDADAHVELWARGQVLPGADFRSKESSASDFFFFFRRDALKEQFGKEPNRVSCLAVKSALLGTRHPRKEKEAAVFFSGAIYFSIFAVRTVGGSPPFASASCRALSLPFIYF